MMDPVLYYSKILERIVRRRMHSTSSIDERYQAGVCADMTDNGTALVYAARVVGIRSETKAMLYNSDIQEPALFGYVPFTR